jgi:nitrous oxide reductase accessory protein NosL
MKTIKLIAVPLLVVVALTFALAGCGSKEEQSENTAGAKPYPLDVCLVCGMKLSMMEKPVTFVYEGQTIEVCDASEKAGFEKDPAKYLKNITDAEVAMPK